MRTNSLSNDSLTDLRLLPEPSQRRGGRIYLILWLVLATGAIVYLVALAVAPGPLMAVLGTAKPATSEANETASAPTTSELGDEVARLRDEIDQLRGELRTIAATSQVIADRVDTIENASIQVEDGSASAVAISQGTTKSQVAPEDSDITGIVIGDIPDSGDYAGEDYASEPAAAEPAKKPKSAKAEAVAAAEQALEDLPDDPAPAVKKTFGLELAVSTSPEALQLNWDLLNERHGALLKGLSARTQANAADPSSYRLVAGPFANAQQAQSLCAKLKKQSVACQVTGFGNDNL